MGTGWRAGIVLALLCAAGVACEDARPASAPPGPDERNELVQRWNRLEARLEADNEARVHARLDRKSDAELNAAVVRAGEQLHEARRQLDTLRDGFPAQARAEKIGRIEAALGAAEDAVGQADGIRESAAATDAGPAPPGSADEHAPPAPMP